MDKRGNKQSKNTKKWRDNSWLLVGEEGSGGEEEAAAEEESEIVDAEESGDEEATEGEDGESGKGTKDAAKKTGGIYYAK